MPLLSPQTRTSDRSCKTLRGKDPPRCSVRVRIKARLIMLEESSRQRQWQRVPLAFITTRRPCVTWPHPLVLVTAAAQASFVFSCLIWTMPACLVPQLDLPPQQQQQGRAGAGQQKAFENAVAYRFYFCVPSHTSCVRFSSALFDWHYCIIIIAGTGLAACQQIKNGSARCFAVWRGGFSCSCYLTEAIITPWPLSQSQPLRAYWWRLPRISIRPSPSGTGSAGSWAQSGLGDSTVARGRSTRQITMWSPRASSMDRDRCRLVGQLATSPRHY